MIQQVFTSSEGILCLHSTEHGLWLGHHGGVSFHDPESGVHAKWTTHHGVPALPVLHVASDASRLAIATPNGIAWIEDIEALLQRLRDGDTAVRWKRGLMHARGSGAYVNGVAFVDGRIYAATGGGRLYLACPGGFELLELPVQQARLLRVCALASPPHTRRLLLISNNSGVLLLSTGDGEEPSLYQWGEQESLCSRYVTALALADAYVVVGVHGCIHVARQRDLVENANNLSRWGRVTLSDLQAPAEHSRIHALCTHDDHVYAGTSAGLYRIAVAELESAARDRASAERVDEHPVRHVVSHRGVLWAVQHATLGRYEQGGAAIQRRVYDAQQSDARGERNGGRRGEAGSRPERAPLPPRITSFGRRWRFTPEARWRGFHAEPEAQHVVSLAGTPDGVVFGGEAGRIVMHVGERWITENVSRQRRSPEVHSVVHDPDGARLWAATRHGLFNRDTRGRWARELSFPGRTVHQLLVWQGNMVAVGSAGLHAYVQSAWNEIPFVEETPALFAAIPGNPGLVLAGRPGTGFFIWRPGTPQPAPLRLPVGRANCMAWDSDDRLWLGTDRGIVRWDGEQLEAFRWNAEPEDHITALAVHEGRLFVGSQAGVWIAALGRLEPATGEALEALGSRLGLLDGLPDPHVSSMLVHTDCVWVGTQGGLVRLG
jgi:ligand-binding sensor domain-containing protein